MDFCFTEQQEAFRQEVRDFLNKELPAGWAGVSLEDMYGIEEVWAVFKDMARKLGDKGWLSLGWPREYGGQSRSHMDRVIFHEEFAYRKAPGIDRIGISQTAPTLMFFGTEEQKRRHLGSIARGEVVWCQGFSEPGAGSDLAAVQAKAQEKDDYFIITGQKVWTTAAHRADWCFLLARTKPDKRKGLSTFLVDMKSPGLEVRPLLNIAGKRTFNELFLNDVRVPRENLVGGLDNGWMVALAYMSFERSCPEFVGLARRALDDIMKLGAQAKTGGNRLLPSPMLRHRLAEMFIEVEVAKLLTYRVAWMQDKGLQPDSEASQAKVFDSELMQRIANIGMQVAGLYGPLEEGSPWVPLNGMMSEAYLFGPANTIGAGTSEIMRTVIASRGLGLPRN